LDSVGLGLECVPSHSGWELVVWEPRLPGVKLHASEIGEICEEIEVEDSIEACVPQIKLSLENPIDLGEPPVEAAGLAPTVVVEVEEDSSVEVLASMEKKAKDQVEGTGAEPVPETAEIGLRDQSERTVEETVHDVEEAKIGAEPVLEKMKDRSGAEPDLMEVEEAVRPRDELVHEVEESDLFFKDYPGDDFEKVEEYTQEETSQTPLTPAPDHPTEPASSSTELRKNRIKTLAGRTDLPWIRKLVALKAKTSSSSQQTPQKQPSQPTRKSYRLATQGVRSSSVNQGPPVIEEILSSSEESPVKGPDPGAEPLESLILESE